MSFNIYFFNNYHKGDQFHSKWFIKDIINQIPEFNYTLMHHHGPKLLLDLPAKYQPLLPFESFLHPGLTHHIENNNIYFNAWIGCLPNRTSMKLTEYHRLFSIIYKLIATETKKSLTLKDPEYYIPEINFNYFDIPSKYHVDYFNSIIFVNGSVHSGQSNLGNNKIDQIVSALTEEFKDKKFILTSPSNVPAKNIVYTSNIINTNDCDLNEISWLAEKCKFIVARNTGPFAFMQTKNVLNDKEKTIISFGNFEPDCYAKDLNIPCSYNFFIDKNINTLIDNIIISIKLGRCKTS